MAQAKDAFEWVSIIDANYICHAVLALHEAKISNNADLVSGKFYFFNPKKILDPMSDEIYKKLKNFSVSITPDQDSLSGWMDISKTLLDVSIKIATIDNGIKHAKIPWTPEEQSTTWGIVTTEKILKENGFKFEKIEGQDKQMRAVLR